VFVIARQAGHLVIEVWRAVVGPVARDDALAFYPYLTVVSNAVYTVLLVGLLAAAIDRIIRRREISATEAPRMSAATTTP
jgi:Na+/phosphate symporter